MREEVFVAVDEDRNNSAELPEIETKTAAHGSTGISSEELDLKDIAQIPFFTVTYVAVI